MARGVQLRPAPSHTDNLRVDLMHIASLFQNKPEMFTEAMQDQDTRKELTDLVNDLFQLTEVIEAEHGRKAVR